MTRLITEKDVSDRLNWTLLIEALKAGHKLPKAETGDQLLGGDKKTLLSRAAFIEGLGFGVKSVSVHPDNVHDGALQTIIDSALITNWKTAADSVLGARLLARPDSANLLIIGAGSVAEQLVRAYSEIFPTLKTIAIWNRTAARAESLVKKLRLEGYPVSIAADRKEACAHADIISSATLSSVPLILGDWVQDGTHIDLIGAYTPNMREADDGLMQKSRIFVDSFETTVHHIGELMIPLKTGAISEADILADFYGLLSGADGRLDANDITVFKNGGGAHLDLMTAHCIMDCLK